MGVCVLGGGGGEWLGGGREEIYCCHIFPPSIFLSFYFCLSVMFFFHRVGVGGVLNKPHLLIFTSFLCMGH